jgi:hypothetical protein
MHLPMLDVEFVFHGYTKADIDSVMTRFFAHFHRGGG